MADDVRDFYAGFEGEPEFLVFVAGALRLRCWEGYLAALLESVQPRDGRWRGLAEAYHLDLWGEGPWQVPSAAECAGQLREVGPRPDASPELAREAMTVRDALVELFEEAAARGVGVVVRRD